VVWTTASAQSVSDLQRGARIKVTPATGKERTGAFVSFANDSLSFVINDVSATRLVLPLAQVKSVRVSKGRNRSRGSVKGLIIGSLAGVAAGAMVGAASTTRARGDCILDCTKSQSAMFAGIFYGSLGVIGGAIVGGIVGSEDWQRIDLRKPK
jgi:hypothetical protein